MSNLTNRNILIGITGSIAAYKTIELIRRLKEQGANIRVVMTQSAHEFVTPTTLQAVSGHPIRSDLWNTEDEAGMDHISFARWPDLILIAPASANAIAKLAHGLADDLLSTLCLATTAPIAIAPAMNQQMWQAPATEHNVKTLATRNVMFLGPGEGNQACGENGPGRMLEPNELVHEVITFFENDITVLKPPTKRLNHISVLITAGPTQEALDPVRYLSNHSSGKMGYALAAAAKAAGANVTLVSGPTKLTAPKNINTISVLTATEMLDAVMTHIYEQAIFIGCAAVADYRPAMQASQKIKKDYERMSIELTKNPDILYEVGHLETKPFTIGFAAETENLIEHAKIKLTAKKADMIIANQVGNGLGFMAEDNQATAIWQTGEKQFSHMPKAKLAEQLIELITDKYYETNYSSKNLR